MREGIAYQYTESQHDGSHDYLIPIVRPMLQALPAGSTILDMGCGNGSFLSALHNGEWRMIGIDFSPSGIDVARRTNPLMEFFLADAQTDLRQQIGQVDAILSTEVIEHLYDPRAFLTNAYNLLKAGGIFIVSTPYHGYLKNLMLAATGKMDEHFTVLWDHGHIKFWSRQTLTQALSETGFKIQEFRGAGRLPYMWKSMVLRATR